MIENYSSFGRFPKVQHKEIIHLFRTSDSIDFENLDGSVLPYGLGKSYGDSCLNPDNYLIDISKLNRFISFDSNSGILKAESGVTLQECIDVLLPQGYFLPVTPGTKLITLGGAVANDVHGKNHHKFGTFGCHILSFELLRSDGQRFVCSKEQNKELFKATIGGLGLTGIILWVEFKAVRIEGPVIDAEFIKFGTFGEFFEINEESGRDFDFTVAWVNTTKFGHGIYSRGNFANQENQKAYIPNHNQKTFPFDYDFINPLTVKIFNFLYEGKQLSKFSKNLISFEPFFYPLDAVNNWNLAYGKRGFLQYQFVIPFDDCIKNLEEIFKIITKSGLSSFLTVLKTFGDIKSPGMLSFPKPGLTLAIDFKMTGNNVLKILERTDDIVRNAGGILYPAKDARMKGEDFRKFYPQYIEFQKYIDPRFNSGFWKRVMK